MTASVLQERATDANATGANISLAFSSNNTAGSAIHCIATWGHNADDFASAQDTNNTYGSVLKSVKDTTALQGVGQAIAVNVASGPNTVQANFTNTPGFRGILIREIGGVSAAPNDGNNGQFQSAPGTGTDAVSSTNATNSVQPVFMSAVSNDNGFAQAPAAGTGFTAGITGWLFGGPALAQSEHQRFTTTTAK